MLTKPQVFYDDDHKNALGYQNPLYLRKAQRKQPVLYNANVLAERHEPISMCDSKETMILAEENRTVISVIRIGSWRVSHIKDAYEEEVLPFVKNLRESFTLFEKEINNKYFEIDDLKAQLQEKSIVVNELKKLLAKLKGKSQVTPCVEKIDLSKTVTSHLHTNKITEKCLKVLAPSLLRIESEPINSYFKNNRVVHRDYLKVTKEHIETLQELLEQARVVKPFDENLDYACKFPKRIQEILVYVYASCPYAQSGNEKRAPATSHRKNNKPYADISRPNKTVVNDTQKHAVKQNTQKTDNTRLPSIGRVTYTNASGSKPMRNTRNDRIP
ncbi:hypothetical protein Tco_1154232 [Tanacetum coccineum]